MTGYPPNVISRRADQLRDAIRAGQLVQDDNGRLWHHCDDPTGPDDVAAIASDTRIVEAFIKIGLVRVGDAGVLTLTPQPLTEVPT